MTKDLALKFSHNNTVITSGLGSYIRRNLVTNEAKMIKEGILTKLLTGIKLDIMQWIFFLLLIFLDQGYLRIPDINDFSDFRI